MIIRARRTRFDAFRMEYRRRVTTAAGREVVVRARRKIDAETVDPVDVPLPLAIVAIWSAVRGLRNHSEYGHRWIVEMFPRFDPAKPEILAESSKREALDLVDEHASRIAEAN